MSTPTPIRADERVEIMDVLRGVALFGVFLMNLAPFAGKPIMATEQQLLSLPSAAYDFALLDVLRWLFADKANTIFAFLFGLGFYLQMQRLQLRGADFEALYKRRLTVLLCIGLAHLLFLWTWDILHLYALAGFILLQLRRLSNRDLLAVGIILGLLGRTAQKTLDEFNPGSSWTGLPGGYADSDILLRQQISESGDYFGLVVNFFDWVVVDYLASGMIFGWLSYALGRFLIGAWVGRHGWIERAREFLPGWRRVRAWCLPVGLIVEGMAVMLSEASWLPEGEHREFLGECLHLFAVPVLATGYVAALVVAFEGRRGHAVLAPFAAVGRMALTNYLTQSLVIGFVLFGVGPGLALAGKIGTAAITGIVVASFALQMIVSRWWLGHFAYGPAEWVWRALTYGERPAMRIRPRLERGANEGSK
jgi:uncharacterized protein